VMLASAALYLGIGSIETMPLLRRFWSSLLLLLMVILPAFSMLQFGVAKLRHKLPPAEQDTRNLFLAPGGGEPASAIVLSAPCPVMYTAPTIWPDYRHTAAQECLSTGFFRGMQDVLTTATIEQKIGELRSEPRRPLLLHAGPLEEQFAQAPTETQPATMRAAEGAFYLPPVRHKPLDYGPVIQAIREDYTPGPVVAGGLQVWEPKTTGR
jgi:hypothetical protein